MGLNFGLSLLLAAALCSCTSQAAIVPRQDGGGPTPFLPPPAAPAEGSPCDLACPLDYRPVCGSDGVTYSNLCLFNATVACVPEAANLTLAYEGQCGCAPVSNLAVSTSVVAGTPGTQPQQVSVTWDPFQGSDSFLVCIEANEGAGGVATTCTSISNGSATGYSTVIPGDWTVTKVTVGSTGPEGCEANEASTETIASGNPATCDNVAPAWYKPFAQPEVLITQTSKSLEVRVTWLPSAPLPTLTTDEYTQALNDIKSLVQSHQFWQAHEQVIALADQLDNPDNLDRKQSLLTISGWLLGTEQPTPTCEGKTVLGARNCLVNATVAELDNLLADAPNLVTYDPLVFDGYEVCVVQEALNTNDQYRQCALYPLLPTVQKMMVTPQSDTVSIWAEVRPLPSCLLATQSSNSISTRAYVPLKQIKPPSTAVDNMPVETSPPAAPPVGEPEVPIPDGTTNDPNAAVFTGPESPPPGFPTDTVVFTLASTGSPNRRRQPGQPEDSLATATANPEPSPTFFPPPPASSASNPGSPSDVPPPPPTTPTPLEPIIRDYTYWCLFSSWTSGTMGDLTYYNVTAGDCDSDIGDQVGLYVQNGQYRTSNNLCLDTLDGETGVGTIVVLADCKGDRETQTWTYTNDGNLQPQGAGVCAASDTKKRNLVALAECGTDWNLVWYWDSDNSVPPATDGGFPTTASVPDNAQAVPDLPPPITIIPVLPPTPTVTETITITPTPAPTPIPETTTTTTIPTEVPVPTETPTNTTVVIDVPVETVTVTTTEGSETVTGTIIETTTATTETVTPIDTVIAETTATTTTTTDTTAIETVTESPAPNQTQTGGPDTAFETIASTEAGTETPGSTTTIGATETSTSSGGVGGDVATETPVTDTTTTTTTGEAATEFVTETTTTTTTGTTGAVETPQVA